MNKYEEIFYLSNLISIADDDKTVDFTKPKNLINSYLIDTTKVSEDYLINLDDQGILYYEEIGEDGFEPIIMCSLTDKNQPYLKELLLNLSKQEVEKNKKIVELNKRISEILTFSPQKLANEIKSTEEVINKTRNQIESNNVLNSLTPHLDKIETHFKSLSKVANNYEDIYKNIILPIKEEGRIGVKQTVKWAIISIIGSTLISVLITLLTR